jgi:uncharacterized membrane protein
MLSFQRFPLFVILVSERPTQTTEDRTRLRWKLLVITSLIAALIGAAGSYSLFQILAYYNHNYFPVITKYALAEAFSFVTSGLAAIFVYRHTARRRKTQALITFLLSLFLFQAILYSFLSILPRWVNHF